VLRSTRQLEIWMSRKALRAGVTAIEYALIGGSVALVLVTGVTLLGGNVTQLYQSVATAVSSVGGQ
jgi:Flp pilus assembly pilin Flp